MASDELRIGKCDPSDLRAALELVLQPLAPDHRAPLVESLQRQRGEPLGPYDALVTARQAKQLVGAAWAQPQPGATAALWLPQAVGVRIDRVATPLIESAMRLADQAGVELSQVLLESERDDITPDLKACGFRRLTSLDYLEWSCESPNPPAPESSAAIEFVPVTEIDRGDLEQLVAQTYVDTLDCPELDGLRSMADVLAGYEQTGDHDPALWFVLRHSGQDVGVLFLCEHQSSRQMELIYVGVCPPARGQRLGYQAISTAQKIAADRKTERLVLAVDTRNTPAKAIYETTGFQTWTQRVVYLRPRPKQK